MTAHLRGWRERKRVGDEKEEGDWGEKMKQLLKWVSNCPNLGTCTLKDCPDFAWESQNPTWRQLGQKDLLQQANEQRKML